MTTEIVHNGAANRFEIQVDGEVAGLAEYVTDGDALRFNHTETDERFQGQGLARQLVEAALESTRQNALGVIPECPYVRKVVAEAPDRWLDLVPEGRRAEFDL